MPYIETTCACAYSRAAESISECDIPLIKHSHVLRKEKYHIFAKPVIPSHSQLKCTRQSAAHHCSNRLQHAKDDEVRTKHSNSPYADSCIAGSFIM